MLLSFQLAAKPSLKVTVPDDYYPYYFKDQYGAYKGVSYEVVSSILNKLGYEIEVTQVPSMRVMLAELERGNQDLSINLTATDERLEVALFTSTPHVYETQNLIVRADSPIQFNGELLPLQNFIFGPIFGWTYGPDFDREKSLKKDYVNDSVEQMKSLLAGRYDIALNNPQFFLNTAKQFGISGAFKVLEPAIFTLPVTIAVSKQYPQAAQLVSEIEQAVIDFKQTARYTEILEKYGFERESEEGSLQ